MGSHVSKFCVLQGEKSPEWIAEDLKLQQMKIAVIGNESSGKSKFIDAMRGLQSYWFVGDDDVADLLPEDIKIAQNEEILTRSVSGRKYRSCPNKHIIWHLIPRTHFVGMAVEDFIKRFGLASFDIIVLMIDSAILDIELLLYKLLRELGKKAFFVFSRFDMVLKQKSVQLRQDEDVAHNTEFVELILGEYRDYFNERTTNASIMGRVLFNEPPRVYFVTSLLQRFHELESTELIKAMYDSVDTLKRATFLVECQVRTLHWIGEKFISAAHHVESVGNQTFETGLLRGKSEPDLEEVCSTMIGILGDLIDLFGLNLWQVKAYLGNSLWNTVDSSSADAICQVTSVCTLIAERQLVKEALEPIFASNSPTSSVFSSANKMDALVKFCRTYLKSAIIKCRDASVILLVLKSQYFRETLNQPLTPHKSIPDNLPRHLLPHEKDRTPPPCPGHIENAMMFHGTGLRDRFLGEVLDFAEMERNFYEECAKRLEEGTLGVDAARPEVTYAPELELEGRVADLRRHFFMKTCKFLTGNLMEMHWVYEGEEDRLWPIPYTRAYGVSGGVSSGGVSSGGGGGGTERPPPLVYDEDL